MNILRVVVDNPEELLNAGAFGAGALLRVEKSTDGVTYTPLTTAALVSGTTLYKVYDQSGPSTNWYRTRFSDAAATNFSDYSAPFQVGEGPESYATLGGVRLKLGLAVADVTDDPRIESIVESVNTEMEGRITTPIGPSPLTQMIFDGSEAICREPTPYSNYQGYGYNGRLPNALFIRRGVRSISLLEMQRWPDTTWVTVDPTNYLIGPPAADRDPGWPGQFIILIGTTWTYFYPGYQNVRATGGFGFASIPTDLREMGNRVAYRAWLADRAGQQDVTGLDELGQPLVSSYFSLRDRLILKRYRDGTRKWYD